MEISISHLELYSGILAGAQQIQKNRENLNLANAFPVPDQDTGSNLAHLMTYITRHLRQQENVLLLMDRVSDYALMGARGNSGAIFSQFFTGFCEKCPATESISVQGIAQCFQKGYEKAYHSIAQPVEGTILTAFRSWSEAFTKAVDKSKDLFEIYEHAYKQLRKTVEATQTTLPQQQQLKSVDAGAKAFLYFIEGFMGILTGRHQLESTDWVDLEDLALEEHSFDADQPLTYRYCSEVFFRKEKGTSIDYLRQQLMTMGDSLVVSDNNRFVRIHCHVSQPTEMLRLIDSQAEILETKVDDMSYQRELTHHHSGKIALVIDSIADIPEKFLTSDVYCLPMTLMVNGVSYADKRNFFLELLEREGVSSSQLNEQQVKAFLHPILKSYDQVLIMTVSSKMSGLYERCQAVINQWTGTTDIRLIDTLRNSGAEGLLVYRALNLIADGQPLSAIVEQLEKDRLQTEIFVSLPNLKRMMASGRLNQKIGFFLQKVGFLPLITINQKGEGKTKGLIFSKKQNENQLYEQVLAEPIEDYVIVHAQDAQRAERVGQELNKLLGKPALYIAEISAIIQNFSGKGSLAIAYIRQTD